ASNKSSSCVQASCLTFANSLQLLYRIYFFSWTKKYCFEADSLLKCSSNALFYEIYGPIKSSMNLLFIHYGLKITNYTFLLNKSKKTGRLCSFRPVQNIFIHLF